MEEGPESVAGTRRSGGNDPVFVEEGIADDMLPPIFTGDIGEGKGEGVLAVLKDGGRAAAELFVRLGGEGGNDRRADIIREDSDTDQKDAEDNAGGGVLHAG